MYTSTRRLAYRQELDILENLESALNDCANVEDTVFEVADHWPTDPYTLRVLQWLHAGSPDLDETSATDGYQTATELVRPENRNSISKAIHDMIGTALFGMARDYMFDVVDPDDHPTEARAKVLAAITEHRADLMKHDGHAMTPPYEFGVWYGYDHDYTVHVTPRP
jgi:hypothetical protein